MWDKYLNKKREQKCSFVCIACVHLIVLAVILLFCDVKLEVSDDFVMEMILSGVYTGANDIHIMFSNVIWACILLPFYKLFPGVNWYLLGQLLVCLLSLITVTYVIFQIHNKASAVFTSALITVFVAMDLYILPQFTKTAIAAVFSGSILFLWALFYKKNHKTALLGGLLVLVGSWIRFSVIYIAGPFIIIMLLCEIVRMIRSAGFAMKDLARVAIPGLSLIALVFACSWFSDYVYSLDESYSYYRQYSKARANVVDYAYPSYAEYEEDFKEIGISLNDYVMLTSWNYGDSEAYDLETLHKVGDILSEYREEQTVSRREFLYLFRDRQLRYPGAGICILLGVYCIAIDWKRAWIPITAAAVVVGFFFYYYCIGRKVYRVEFGYYLCAAILLAFYCNSPSRPAGPIVKIIYPVVALAMTGALLQSYIPDQSTFETGNDAYRSYVDDTFYYSWNYDEEKYSKIIKEGEIRPNFLREVREHPDRLYVMEFYTTIQTFYYDFSPFESAKNVFPSNVVYLGGVTVNHPSVVDSLYHEDTGKLLEKLLDDNAYLVTNRAQDIIYTFFIEHGHPNVQMELYDTIDGYNIWKYTE